MAEHFIIVERDSRLRDIGVFTGQIQIVDTRLYAIDGIPMQAMDGVSSPEIEHTFLFNFAHTAWRFAMQFEPHWDCAAARYLGARRWVVRKDLHFFPGEVRHGLDVPNPIQTGRYWIPQEALMAATAEGYEQGRRSALAEMS